MHEDEHFLRLARLLDQESEAQAQRLLERAGRLKGAAAEQTGQALVGLVIRDETTALGGRWLLTMGKRDLAKPLPWTRLGVGSPVLLSEENVREPGAWRGVVSDRDAHTIQVACEVAPEPEGDRPTFRLDLSADEIAHKRQRAALDRARAATGGMTNRLVILRDVLLGRRPARFGRCDPLEPYNTGLDRSQLDAIQWAMSAQDLALIHGPPGTGKTTTVVELIRQAVRRGERVLACAPSNLAVDNLLERLVAGGERVVRLGHPARVMAELRAHTLDLMVDQHDDVILARKLLREASSLRDKASKWTRAKPEPGQRHSLRAEARQLVTDARRLEQQVVNYILDTTPVLLATLTSLDNAVLGSRTFDLVVIDEACQTTEPACWIPLSRCERVVLAGDHCQLPPTVVSQEAARGGFDVSLLERLMRVAGNEWSKRLSVQYRMHRDIMEFSSCEFYEGTLEAASHVAGHLLTDLPSIVPGPTTDAPLRFIDTAGAGHDEQLEPDGESRRNPGEAEFVEREVAALIEAGLPATGIAVIAPYAAQVRLLRERLAGAYPELEIDTVDGFQGREKEAVVISLVRSNSTGELGFLNDVRRMNVALTRAKRRLVVIGDSATVGGHPFYARMIDYFQSLNAYATVWEM